MKHVKLFESFLGEAKVVSTKTKKLNKTIEEKVKLAAKLAKELKAELKAYEAKVKPLQEILNKYDEEILNTLTAMQANQVKVGEVIARVMMQKGRLTDSYKMLWDEALTKVNDETRRALLEFQTANKKKNPDKYWMEYQEASEGLKDIKEWGSKMIDKVKTWAKDVWSGIKSALNKQEDAIENLEAVADKITK